MGGSTVSIGNAQAILQALIQRGASPQDTTTKATPKLFMDPRLISAVGLAWIYYCFLSTAFLEFMIVRLDFLKTLFNLCLAHSSLHDFCRWIQHMREISGVVLVVMVVVVVAAGAAASLQTVHTVLVVHFYLFFACLKVCLVYFDPYCFFLLLVLSCAVVLYLRYLCRFVFLSSSCLSFLCFFFSVFVFASIYLLSLFEVTPLNITGSLKLTHEDEAWTLLTNRFSWVALMGGYHVLFISISVFEEKALQQLFS